MSSYQAAAIRKGAAKAGNARAEWRQNFRRRARTVLVAISLIVGGLLLARGIRARHHAQLLASLKIAAANQDRAQLTEAMNNGRITRDEGRALMRDVWVDRQQKQMDEYFALPPGDARNQVMDKLIDDREARRKEMEARRAALGPAGAPPRPMPGGPSAAGPQGPGGPNAAARATRIESIPPASRAQWQQFRYDMNQRLAARGMQTVTGR
ncbi:MAG: hypothetical protein JWO87_1265 [Phycisphaerales bacterium]|nr:hypothetical protein [Phycisphaerales bacterium]